MKRKRDNLCLLQVKIKWSGYLSHKIAIPRGKKAEWNVFVNFRIQGKLRRFGTVEVVWCVVAVKF